MILIVQGAVQAAASADKREVRRLTEAEFDDFYRRNGRSLLAYITRLCGDATLADDLFQKAFYQFLRAEVPAGDETQMRPYLYRIALNVVRDEWRKDSRGREMELSEHTDPVQRHSSVETAHDFQKTFQKLTPNERALLWLAHVEELEHRDVAKRVGVGEKSVRVLLHRARKKMAGLLEQVGWSEEKRS